jgi:hypothetical protein
MIFILFLPSLIYSQFTVNKHILGPSVGFSFLGSTVQLGLNHEYALDLREIGVEEGGSVGVGGILRYWSYSENFVNVSWDYTDILLGVQANYHFYMADDKIDPWFGLILAYDFGSSKAEIKTPGFRVGEESHDGIWLGVNAGIRYWFEENMAMNIRIGFGTFSYGAVDLGFDYKLN